MTVTTHNAVNTGNQPLLRRVASASAIGTAAEYYDFFAYGTAAVLFFGQLFFPSADPLISTLAAFATYAVGFLARPLGGIVFGHIGDKVGRKKALVITILIVGLGTFCIGLLPTYEQIGIWAPLALIFIRVLQGFGVGGEQAGAVLMTAEYAPPPQRGFYASWVQIGAPAGFLLPSGLFALLTAVLSPAQMLDWGWRIPFLLSLLLVLVGLFIRLRIDESPVFTQIRATKAVESRPGLPPRHRRRRCRQTVRSDPAHHAGRPGAPRLYRRLPAPPRARSAAELRIRLFALRAPAVRRRVHRRAPRRLGGSRREE